MSTIDIDRNIYWSKSSNRDQCLTKNVILSTVEVKDMNGIDNIAIETEFV